MANNKRKKHLDNAKKAIKQAGNDFKTGTGKVVKHAAGAVLHGVVGDEKNVAKHVLEGASGSISKGISMAKNLGKAALELGKALVNHPEWYTKTGDITVNLGYSTRKGANNDFDIAAGTLVETFMSIPGVRNGNLSTDTITCQAYTDGIVQLYTKLRSSNSGSYNYTVDDLALYIEYVRSMIVQLAQVRKMLKAINTFSAYEIKTNQPLLYTVGYNSTAMINADRNGFADLINRYNRLIRQVAEVVLVPPHLSYFQRADWLHGNVFVDDDDPKASYISFVPNEFWTSWTAADKELTSTLVSFTSPYSATQFLASVETMLTNIPFISNYIAGDMMKAYGDEAFLRIPELNVNDQVEFVYDKLVLNQLGNATTGFAIPTASPSTVVVTDGTVVETIQAALSVNNVASSNSTVAVDSDYSTIISAPDADVTSGETLSLTRLATPLHWVANASSSSASAVATIINDFICGSLHVISFSDGQIVQQNPGRSYIGAQQLVGDGLVVQTMVGLQIHGAPRSYVVTKETAGLQFAPIGNLENFAYMSKDQARTLSDTATLSMLKTINVNEQANYRAPRNNR